jgi:hypothetical protein
MLVKCPCTIFVYRAPPPPLCMTSGNKDLLYNDVNDLTSLISKVNCLSDKLNIPWHTERGHFHLVEKNLDILVLSIFTQFLS